MKEEYISLNGARNYKLIIFSHPQINSSNDFLNNIKSILAKGEKRGPIDFPFGLAEDYVPDNNSFKVTRAKIKSRIQLWNPPAPGETEGSNSTDEFFDARTKDFLYPLYIGSCETQTIPLKKKVPKHKLIPTRFHIMAVPFFSLLSHIDRSLNLDASEITYYKVSLSELMTDLYRKKEEYPFVRLTMYQGEPTDEPLLGQCRISVRNAATPRPDIDDTSTLGNIVDTKLFKYFQECGVKPFVCRIKFDDFEGHRLSVLTDKFGNFNFYLRKEGLNIVFFSYLLQHFVQNGWFEATTTKPSLRAMEEMLT